MKKILISIIVILTAFATPAFAVNIEIEEKILSFDQVHENNLRDFISQIDDQTALLLLKILERINQPQQDEILNLLREEDIHENLKQSLIQTITLRNKKVDFLEDVIESSQYLIDSKEELRRITFRTDQYKDATYSLLDTITILDSNLYNKQSLYGLFNRIIDALISGDTFKAGTRINALFQKIF